MSFEEEEFEDEFGAADQGVGYFMEQPPDDGFTVKDSGTRTEYASGMVRDGAKVGKVNYTRIFDGVMAGRWARHLARAEPKYPDVAPGVPNWTLADSPAEQEDYRVSAARHFIQWLAGEQDEDHAAAVYFNIDGYETVELKLDLMAAEEDQA